MPYHVRVYTCVLFVCVRVRTHVYVHANTLRHRSIGRHKQKSRFKRNKTIVNQDLWYLFCYVDILKQKLNNTCVCARARASLSFQQLPPGRIWARGSQWDLESRRVTMVTMWKTDGWGQAGRRRPPEDTTVTVGYNRDQRERGERRLPVAPPLNPAGTLHVCWTPRCSAGWWWRTACLSK